MIKADYQANHKLWRAREVNGSSRVYKGLFRTKEDAENLINRVTLKNVRLCWIENNVCHIPLANGKVALCDEDRFDEVSQHNWCEIKAGYVSTSIKEKGITLHKFLYPESKTLDHANWNKLDNRSCNLRECTNSQNSANRKIGRNMFGFKGVRKDGNKIRAVIIKDGRQYFCGYHSTPEEAARAYDKKAKEFYDEFAVLNFEE